MNWREYIGKLKQHWILVVALALIIGVSAGVYMLNNNSLPVATPSYKYVGSVNSDKFHYPDCRWAQNIIEENEIWFNSKEDATAKGYRPCQTCRP